MGILLVSHRPGIENSVFPTEIDTELSPDIDLGICDKCH